MFNSFRNRGSVGRTSPDVEELATHAADPVTPSAEHPEEASEPDADLDGGTQEAGSAAAGDAKTSHRWRRRPHWGPKPRAAIVFAVLPALAMTLAVAAGVLKYLESTARDGQSSAVAATQVAKDSTVALLSYDPATVEQQLDSARGLLTGTFRDSYGDLVRDVVIPGAKQKNISAKATVPAAATVSATERHAVVLVFVDQTVVVGNDAPAGTSSAIRVTVDKVGEHWLISQFDPI